MANKYVQLRDAQGNNIFPRINTLNVVNDAKFVNETQLAEAIANAQHLKKEIVTALPSVAEAKEDTIYLILKAEGDAGYVEGENIYDEFMLINGKFEKLGNTKVDLANYYTKGEVDSAIDAVEAFTVNSKRIDSNPVLNGADIALTGYTAITGGAEIVAADTVNAAFAKIDNEIKTLKGDSTESLGAIAGRVTTLEGEMDAVEGRLDVVEPKVATLESITKGYTTEGEIKAAVDAKAEQSAVDAVIGSEGTLTKAVAANAAAVATKAEQSVVNGIDGRLQTAEGEIDVLQGALSGLLSEGAVQSALDLKANVADVEAKIGAEGTITKAVEANTTAIANMGNIISLSYVEINADGTEIEG